MDTVDEKIAFLNQMCHLTSGHCGETKFIDEKGKHG